MLNICLILDVEIERVCGGLSGGPGGARCPPCRGQCRAPELSAEHAPGSSDQLLPLPPRAAHPLLQEYFFSSHFFVVTIFLFISYKKMF